jgi:cobalt-zinc-cadmium resistance protein CzcA
VLAQRVAGGGDVSLRHSVACPCLKSRRSATLSRRLNLHADEINAVVSTALGGEDAGVDDRRQQALSRRGAAAGGTERLNLAGLKQLPVLGEGGVQVPLERVADIAVADRIGTINREDTQRRVGILINVRGRDTEGFVLEAQAKASRAGEVSGRLLLRIRRTIRKPPGRARPPDDRRARRARADLRADLRELRQRASGLLIFLCVPLAATGGVVALWLRGMPFTISAGVGFIALVRHRRAQRHHADQLHQSAPRGGQRRAQSRDRGHPDAPSAKTDDGARCLPRVRADGDFDRAGAEVQRPLATVVIGGVITSTFLTLILLPVLYDWMENRRPRPSREMATHRSMSTSQTRLHLIAPAIFVC